MPPATTDLSRRALGPEDLGAVTALLAASDEAVLGHRDFTEAEIAADLRRGDIERYGWYDGAGTLVGYGWAGRLGTSDKGELDVYVVPSHDRRLGVDILCFLEERVRALVAEAGHGTATFDIGVYRQDERTRAWMAECGFGVATTFTRMRIDLDGAPASTDLGGSSVTVRRSDRGEPDLRLAHRINEASFVDHYGNVAKDFDQWHTSLTEQGEDWATVWLAELDGEPVGVLIGTAQFEPDQDAGYVRTLGTLAPARGRGVAKALLRAYFDASRRAGRAAVLLHVDVANVTNALGVYESVGMRTVLEIDAWAKTAPASG